MSNFIIKNGKLTKYIGSEAHVTIPEGITDIDHGAFENCQTLQSVVLPQTVQEIAWNAFCNCINLRHVTIPDSTTSIGPGAFSNTPWLKAQGDMVIINGTLLTYQGTSSSISIPEGVVHICGDAFASCSALKRIDFPSSISEFVYGLFSECKNLTHLTVSAAHPRYRSEGNCIIDGTTLIAGSCSPVVPKGITVIGAQAFLGRTRLKTITLPVGVTTICEEAFAGCSGLTHIDIPDTVTTIENDAFGINILARSGSAKAVGCRMLKSLSIPDSVTSIGTAAFAHCGVTSMYLSKQIDTIDISDDPYGSEELCGCDALRSLQAPGLTLTDYPANTKKILVQGFMDNPDLYAPDKQKQYIQHISRQRKTLLPEIVLTENIKTLSIYTQCGGSLPPSLRDELIDLASRNEKNNMLAWLLDYKNRTADRKKEEKEKEHTEEQQLANPYLAKFLRPHWSWSKQEDGTMRIDKYKGEEIDIVFPPMVGSDPVTAIAGFVCTRKPTEHVLVALSKRFAHDFGFPSGFDGANPRIQKITVSEGVTVLEDWAFHRCSGLLEIVLPSSLTVIGDGVWRSCTGLKKIELPQGITSIGRFAFAHCWNLNSIVIPDSVTSIGEGAFIGCLTLASISLPAHLRPLKKWSLPETTQIIRRPAE